MLSGSEYYEKVSDAMKRIYGVRIEAFSKQMFAVVLRMYRTNKSVDEATKKIARQYGIVPLQLQKTPLAKRVVVVDMVNQPPHYKTGKIEVIDYIEDKGFGYHLGNCVKYISRAGKKDPAKTVEDLKKAQWYLNRIINNLEKSKK